MSSMVIFVTGPHGAGKTEFCIYVAQEYNLYHIELGDIVRLLYKQHNAGIPFSEWSIQIEKDKGSNYINNLILEYILQNFDLKNGSFLISGNRSAEGIAFLKEKLNCQNNSVVFYLDAPESLLYERWKNREQCSLNINQFKSIYLDKDATLGLYSIRNIATFKIINDSSLQNFYNKIDKKINIINI